MTLIDNTNTHKFYVDELDNNESKVMIRFLMSEFMRHEDNINNIKEVIDILLEKHNLRSWYCDYFRQINEI